MHYISDPLLSRSCLSFNRHGVDKKPEIKNNAPQNKQHHVNINVCPKAKEENKQ